MSGSVYQTAHNSGDIRIYAGFTEGDIHLTDYVLQRIDHSVLYPDGMPTGFKWNLLAEQAMKDGATIFMLCADDIIFSTPCWDKALLEHYRALDNKIHAYHLLDARTGHGTPHPIVTKEYIEAMGYFLPPLMLHWFVDTWTVEIAKAAGCFTHMTDYQLLHDKPSDRGKPDKTHTGIRDMGWHSRDQWTHEHSQHILEFEKRRLQAAMLLRKGKIAV
jgi:hypothetical protein